MSGSNVAADTLPLRTQMRISLIRLLTCIMCAITHTLKMNSSLQEPIRQVQKKEIKRMGLLNQITKLFTFATDIYLANRYNSVSLSSKDYLLYSELYSRWLLLCSDKGQFFYSYITDISSLLCSAEHSRIHAKSLM